MPRFLFALLFILMPIQAMSKSNIVVLGDSISAGYGLEVGQGWVSLVQKKLAALNGCCDIVNESISGDTSAGGLAKIDRILSIHKPKVLVLELGANDGLQGLPINTLKSNLAAIIQQAQNAKAKVLLLSMRIPPNYGKRYVDLFYNVYPELAKEFAIPFIPFIMEDVALVKELMQPDGLHPNVTAQPLIADKVWQHLKPFLK